MFLIANEHGMKNRFISSYKLYHMGLFGKKRKSVETKCKECGLELHQPERLERHMKKAHGNVPEKKVDGKQGFQESGGMW